MPESESPAARNAEESEARPARHYPAFYEKAVPIALGVIGLAILVLLVIVLLVLGRP